MILLDPPGKQIYQLKNDDSQPNKHVSCWAQPLLTIRFLLDKSINYHIILSGIAVIMISVVGVIIGILLPIFIFFLFHLGDATLLCFVNYLARSMLSVKFTPMVIFPWESLQTFPSLGRVLIQLRISRLLPPPFPGPKYFVLVDSALSSSIFSLQRKYLVF